MTDHQNLLQQFLQGGICEEIIGGGGGGKSRTTGGFGEAPKIFRFVWVVESLNHPLLFGTNTKDMPHMKFIFVETDDEY